MEHWQKLSFSYQIPSLSVSLLPDCWQPKSHCCQSVLVTVSSGTFHFKITLLVIRMAVQILLLAIQISLLLLVVKISLLVVKLVVKISLLVVKISLLAVKISLLGVKISLLAVKIPLLAVKISLLAVKISLLVVKVLLLAVKISLLVVKITVKISLLAAKISLLAVKISTPNFTTKILTGLYVQLLLLILYLLHHYFALIYAFSNHVSVWISTFVKNASSASTSFELTHEIMVLIALRKLNLQTCMCSNPLGLHIWFLVRPFVYFHTFCVRIAKALVRLRGCAVSPEPSLFAYAISTIISWAGSFHVCCCTISVCYLLKLL